MQARVAKIHDLKIRPVATRRRRGAGSALGTGAGGGNPCAVASAGDEKEEEPMKGIQDCEIRLFCACDWQEELLAVAAGAIIPGSYAMASVRGGPSANRVGMFM